MRAAERSLVAALAFLTRVPVGRLHEVGPDDVARGAILFPLVGAAVGAAGAGVALAARHGLSPLVAAGLGVAAVVALTGALHLDALADLSDAAGGRTPAERLEIMR